MVDYATAALCALMTFFAPCVLPLLPIYLSYFSAEGSENDKKLIKLKTLAKVLAFCAGIALFFLTLFSLAIGASYALSSFMEENRLIIDIVCGVLLVFFGLKFIIGFSIPFLDKGVSYKVKTEDGSVNLLSAFVMGLVISLSMGVCAMGIIFSAMQPILTSDNIVKSITVALTFIIVLCALFVICALLMDMLTGVFRFLRRHQRVINIISGALLIIMGILIATGVYAIFAGLFV